MAQNDELINIMQSSYYQAACEGRISVEDYLKWLPPGYRFCPNDFELLQHYLIKKVNNEPLPPNLIPDVLFYDYDPKDLAARYKGTNETEWYFFTPRFKKYPNGSRPDRATPGGYWKLTGTDKSITSDDSSRNPLGSKKTLDFHEGKHPKGEKTDWKMHEYILKGSDDPQSQGKATNGMMLDTFVLCKLYEKKGKKGGDHERSAATTSQDQQQPMSDDVTSSSSLAMLQGSNNNNNNRPTSTIAASQNIEEASSSPSNLVLPEKNKSRDEFGDQAELIQPINNPDQGLLNDSPMILTDFDPTLDNIDWESMKVYCSAFDVPSSPKGPL